MKSLYAVLRKWSLILYTGSGDHERIKCMKMGRLYVTYHSGHCLGKVLRGTKTLDKEGN